MKILFTVIPAAGHLNPTIPIAQGLQQRGHEILYATGRAKFSLLNRVGIPTHLILPGKADSIEQVYAPIQGYLNSYNPYHIYLEIDYILNFMLAVMEELQELADRWKPDMIVSDFCTPVGAALAKKRGIPWVTTTQTPACIRTRHGTPSNLGGLSLPRHWGHHLRDFGGRLLLEILRSGLSFAFQKRWNELGLTINGPNYSDGLYSPYAILCLVPGELEYPRDWPRQCHAIGSISWSESHQIRPEDWQFLQSPEPKILVTMGTHYQDEKSLWFPKLVKWLESLPYRFLFTWGGSSAGAEVENPSNHIQFTPYIPYSEVLKYVDAVIHHGGAGITCSCLKMGRPALVIPQGFDQPDNAQRVVELGAGIRLNPRHLTQKTLCQAVENLLQTPTYQEQAGRLSEAIADHYSPVENAVAMIETVGRTHQPLYRTSTPLSCQTWSSVMTSRVNA